MGFGSDLTTHLVRHEVKCVVTIPDVTLRKCACLLRPCTGVSPWKVSPNCTIFLYSKNGVFSAVLAMYNGYHLSGRNNSVHVIAGYRLGVLV